MKNKFYSSLLWIGIALASTTSYAKPAHFKKHISSTKGIKSPSRNPLFHKKRSLDNHFSIFTDKRKQPKLQSIYSVRALERRSPSSSIRNSFPPQTYNRNIYPETTESNDRIHSFIVTQNKNDLLDNTNNYRNEIPRHISSVHGTIYSSLALSGQQAGLSNELISQLTNIFAWDIDFATNLHQGDQFTVVYEEAGIGHNPSDSQIVAAEVINQGRIFTAIRYKDSEGNINYYSPEGKPMRKAFLSTPVDFVRISSGFNSHRRHPILNRIRAHKGVDYAARTGTPVKAAGDGEVVFRGRKGGYGQVLIVKHGERYETLYAHLSDFRSGLMSGDLVKQGEVIGYVGQTGLATGPHLHYEFRVDGVHRNPETLNLAQSIPLHAEALADFKFQSQPMLAQLNRTKAKSLFAKNQYNY